MGSVGYSFRTDFLFKFGVRDITQLARSHKFVHNLLYRPIVQSYNRDRQPSLLVIEDNRDQQVLIRYALQQAMPNVESVCVFDEAEAIRYLDECVEKHRDLPRLILLDLYLPEAEDGWQLLQRLKAYPARRSMPVVVLSVSNAEEDIQRSYQLGANSYIAKPLDFEQWLIYFQTLRQYWLETVTLPRQAYEY